MMLNRKNKTQHLATIFLAVMGIGFLATIPIQDTFWGRILLGGFEAGLVGGLADWFAVTASISSPTRYSYPTYCSAAKKSKQNHCRNNLDVRK